MNSYAEIGAYILGATALALLFAFGALHDDSTLMRVVVAAAGVSYACQIATVFTAHFNHGGANPLWAGICAIASLILWGLAIALWLAGFGLAIS